MLAARDREPDEGDRRVVRDGERMRVPLMMMDSLQRAIAVLAGSQTYDAFGAPAGNRPGVVLAASPPAMVADSAVADAAQLEYERYLADAWRSAPPVAPPAAVAGDARDSAYGAHESWLRDAWRGGAA